MKKKLILALVLTVVFTCLLVIGVSAETPTDYIEFGARFPGSDNYITVYTLNAEGDGNPRINFKDYKFYTDIDFTQEIDISTVTGIDFSVAKTHGTSTPVNRMTGPASPFTSCTEVKWFTENKAMDNQIPSGVFKGWTALTSFDFGCATYLNDNALEKTGFVNLVIPSTIKKSGNSVFASCPNLETVTFMGSFDKMGTSMFSGCSNLETVDLGVLTSIGGTMFNQCTSLTTVIIPSTIEVIPSETFVGCTALANVTLNEGLVTISYRAFEGTAITQITIPSTVVTIGEKAFNGCKSLNSVVYASNTSVETIGKSAFSSVPASNLSVPSTVTSIGNEAFYKSGIVSVTIPSGVDSIGSSAFSECKSLTTLAFEEGFDGTLGNSAFYGTSALTSVTMVEGIKEIPWQCFYQTGSFSVDLPDSVEVLAGRAFAESGVLAVNISENSKLKTIASAFNSTKITSLYFPTGVKITESSFSGCQHLEYIYNFENVTLAITVDGVEQNIIPNSFFSECRALKEIKIPHGVTSIGSSVFNRCGSLEVLYIPASVTSINKGAFPGINDWIAPKNAVIYYCGGDANKLLSLTNDGSGNVSSFIQTKIDDGSIVEYNGIDKEYTIGTIVYNANTCDVYYGGVHTWGELIPMFEGQAYVTDYVNASTCQMCQKSDIANVICGPLFVNLGYSRDTLGSAFTYGISLNDDNITLYKQATGKEISYGFILGLYGTEEEAGKIVSSDGKSLISNSIITDFSNVNYEKLNVYNLKVTKIDETQKTLQIYCNAYVIEETNVSYIGSVDEKFMPVFVTVEAMPVDNNKNS